MLITIAPTYIECEGHANYAPFGSDIVCSAVSVLMQILGREIEAYGQVKLELSSGYGYIRFRGERMSTEQRILWNTLIKGLTQIAHAYPQYVKIENIRESTK